MTALGNWFRTELGQCVQVNSAVELGRMLPPAYFSVVLDLGPGSIECLNNLDFGHRLSINPLHTTERASTVIGNWQELPLGKNTTDLIVLQHTLDFSDDPRQVLRECVEVLAVDGWIAILGFNPIGLWGLSRIVMKNSGGALWSARFLSVSRVQDWLHLLGTNSVGVSFFFYRPPINSRRFLNKLSGVENIGSRLWPACSGAYLIIAQKKQLAKHNTMQGASLPRRKVASIFNTSRSGHLRNSFKSSVVDRFQGPIDW